MYLSLITIQRLLLSHLCIQFWGELKANNCRLGFISNGTHVIFAFRTAEQELTFSDFIRWDDTELYLVFLGFTMFAADCCLIQPKDSQTREAVVLAKIIDDICIPEECGPICGDLPEEPLQND